MSETSVAQVGHAMPVSENSVALQKHELHSAKVRLPLLLTLRFWTILTAACMVSLSGNKLIIVAD
jgi:hypothetical protein